MNERILTFPGTGSQRKGMFDTALQHPVGKLVIQEALAALADIHYPHDILTAASTGSDELNSLKIGQVAIFIAGTALGKMEIAQNGPPHYVAGHSLGEFSAAAAAGLISVYDATHTVYVRSDLLNEQATLFPGGFAAVNNLAPEDVEVACKALTTSYGTPDREVLVQRTNINSDSPHQIGVSADRDMLPYIDQAMKKRGMEVGNPNEIGTNIVPGIPFAPHSTRTALLESALHVVLRGVFHPSQDGTELLSSTTATIIPASEIDRNLAHQIGTPINWVATVDAMEQLGIRSIVEITPGYSVLTKLTQSMTSIPTNKFTGK